MNPKHFRNRFAKGRRGPRQPRDGAGEGVQPGAAEAAAGEVQPLEADLKKLELECTFEKCIFRKCIFRKCIFRKFCKFLAGSFSAVSKRNFARK